MKFQRQKMNKLFTDNAWLDYVYWQTENRITLKKQINYLRTFLAMETEELENQNLSQEI